MIELIIPAILFFVYFATIRFVFLTGGYLKIIYKVRSRVKIYTLIGFSLLPRMTYWVYLAAFINCYVINLFAKTLPSAFWIGALVITATTFLLGVIFRPIRYTYVQDRVHDDIARGKRTRTQLNILDSAIKTLRQERETKRRSKKKRQR